MVLMVDGGIVVVVDVVEVYVEGVVFVEVLVDVEVSVELVVLGLVDVDVG